MSGGPATTPGAPGDPARPLAVQALAFDVYGTLFDVHQLVADIEAAFPRHGTAISEVWRRQQLAYTWLRSLMGRYVPLWSVTRDALRYAIAASGLEPDEQQVTTLLEGYLRLRPYPEVADALAALRPRTLAVFSNGNRGMLEPLIAQAGLDEMLDAVLSVEDAGVFKPAPAAYEVVPTALGLPADQIALVSSNTWDVSGAGSYGLRTVWVRRSPAPMDELGVSPDLVVDDLAALADALA